MPAAWRLVKARHAVTAFTGQSSLSKGGRWNSPGIAVVYLSEHQSLAALEIMVHTRPLFPREKYKAFLVEWDESLTERLPIKELPTEWRAEPPSPATMVIGDAWVQAQHSAVLAVPSAIIPAETNFLLNPAHSDFKRLHIHKPIDFAFDPRLLSR